MAVTVIATPIRVPMSLLTDVNQQRFHHVTLRHMRLPAIRR
jgi:hypothetical protein